MEKIAKPPKKRRKVNGIDFMESGFSGKKVHFEGGPSAEEGAAFIGQMHSWPNTLSEAQLNLLVCIKELATERLLSVDETGLEEILPASALQTVGIIMEELAKDWIRKKAIELKDVELVSSKTSEQNI